MALLVTAGKGMVGWVTHASAETSPPQSTTAPGSPRHRKGGSPRAATLGSPKAEFPGRPTEVRVVVGNKRLLADESIHVPHDVDEYMREKEVRSPAGLPMWSYPWPMLVNHLMLLSLWILLSQSTDRSRQSSARNDAMVPTPFPDCFLSFCLSCCLQKYCRHK